MEYKRTQIVVLGPTASGKSAIAAKLAQQLNGVVISVDARQCYSEMEIGTASPDATITRLAKHYNIGSISPDEQENVSQFLIRVNEWKKQLQPNTPIIYAGGSTLYLQALLFGLDDTPAAYPENIRALKQQSEEKGIEVLFEKLQQVDPEYAKKMDGFNTHRIIRALDVYMQSGKPYSSFHREQNFEHVPEDFFVVGLHWKRENLYQRINQRADQMMENGLVEEVRGLVEKYGLYVQSLQTVGYKEVISYLSREFTQEEMVETIKQNTRRYAKRQITWFRRWPFIEWIDMENRLDEEIVEIIYQKHKKLVAK